MLSYSCQECSEAVYIQNMTRIPSTICHFILCNKCIKIKKLISFTKCKKMYFLTNADVNGLKYLYISNKKNISKFYIYDEIETIIINKYGTINKITELTTIKNKQIEQKHLKKQALIKKRKDELLEILTANKLELKNYGDCYSYIHFGTPSIDDIIINSLNNLNDKQNRRIELSTELSKYYIKFDEKNSYCCDYVNNIGCSDLNSTIENIVMSHYGYVNKEYKKDLIIKFD